MKDKVTWREFFIEDIVEIRNGVRLTKSDMNNGEIPFIGASEMNNGVTGFISNKNGSYDNNVLGVNYNGSVGFSFYHPYFAIFSDDVKRLKWIDEKQNNKYTLLFLSATIRMQKVKYAYGYKFNGQRMKRQKILLPIDNKGSLDWQFMEEYMKQKEHELLNKAIKKLEGQLLSNLIVTGRLSDCTWKEFYFTEVFTEIQRGKRLTKSKQTEGDIPYISSTSLNNGVDNFIGNTDGVRLFSNCISLANSGSVGSSFYHHYNFIASDHVTKLQRNGIDEYCYIFMLPLISKLSDKYGFNREINDERIKREKILLPVTENGDIDFQYMSAFMRNIESTTIKQTLDMYLQHTNNEGITKWGGVKWSSLFIEDIAQILSGQDIYEKQRINGFTPYITATANNNGIGYFVGNSNNTLEHNCISVNRNGSVGYCFYHPYTALYGNDTRKLRPFMSNKYISLFITQAISNQKEKYGYGYKMGTGRLKRQKIVLPVVDNDTPDWCFMENYMREVENKQIVNYLKCVCV